MATTTITRLQFDSYHDYAAYRDSLSAPLDALMDRADVASHLYGALARLLMGGARFTVTADERAAIERLVDVNLVRFFTDSGVIWIERND